MEEEEKRRKNGHIYTYDLLLQNLLTAIKH